MRSSRLVTSIVLLVFYPIGFAFVAGCSDSATAAQSDRDLRLPRVEGVVQIGEASRQFIVVDQPKSEATDAPIRAPAHVEFKDGALARLAAPLNGRVVAVHVRTGDRVRAGDALITLDCPDAATARSGIDSVTASLREAKTALQREQRMLEEGIGIERDRLSAETRVAELEADLARAKAGAAFAGAGSGAAVILRAPLSGTIVTLKATAGMAVQQAAEPMVEIGNPAALWIVADVFERDLPILQSGAAAHVDLPAAHGALDGRVVSIGSVVESGLRTAPIRIALTSDSGALRPGMYGRAEIATTSSNDLTLPAEAILVKGKDTVVYVERDHVTFVRRLVVVTPPVDGRVHVISGLGRGDRVVVRGALLLDGAADQLM